MQLTGVQFRPACRHLELLHAESISKARMHHMQGDIAGTDATEEAWEHTCCNAELS